MAYAGKVTRSSNRVLIAMVVITIVIVALWAINGGLDRIQQAQPETAIVSE